MTDSAMVERLALVFAQHGDHFFDNDGPSSASWDDFSPREQLVATAAARAAIEAMKGGWSTDFAAAPHDTVIWVYATDDDGFAYGPASVWKSGNPSGTPTLCWVFDGKHKRINNGVERALLWHPVPQYPGEEMLRSALRSSLKGEGE